MVLTGLLLEGATTHPLPNPTPLRTRPATHVGRSCGKRLRREAPAGPALTGAQEALFHTPPHLPSHPSARPSSPLTFSPVVARPCTQVHTVSPGMVLTDLLLEGATTANKQAFNILCEQPGAACFLSLIL
jgi:hypothetical protein